MLNYVVEADSATLARFCEKFLAEIAKKRVAAVARARVEAGVRHSCSLKWNGRWWFRFLTPAELIALVDKDPSVLNPPNPYAEQELALKELLSACELSRTVRLDRGYLSNLRMGVPT